ncbi:MAG: hypothetical protein IPM06_21335 [Rhizobiales bacterium]|nr:hypothetical protein [Hyphomicrobiales bacterium]
MNYAIQCTDIITGEKGDFAFDTAEYLAADAPLQFRAKSPIFQNLDQLFTWAKENKVGLFCRPVNWGMS